MKINQPRLEAILSLMAENSWDLLLLYGHTWRKDYFRCLVNSNFSGPHALAAITREGEVKVIVCDPWDNEGLNNEAIFEIDFAEGLARFLGLHKNAVVAIAGKEIMQSRFTSADHISATYAIEELRRVKTEDELVRIRQAADLSDRGYQHFADAAQPGMTEYELVAEVEGFLKANGAEDNFQLIASGGTEVVGMKPPTERILQKGDSVITELTPQVDGYWAQICRALILGEPTQKQLEAYAIFAEARQAAEDLLAPGVNIADVARVQNDVFRKFGYGEYTGPRYTRVRGHNLGLHPDENPYVLEDVNYIVKEGMVVIAHPNTYLPLSGYMVFGDTLLVTATGCVSLNKTERKLFSK